MFRLCIIQALRLSLILALITGMVLAVRPARIARAATITVTTTTDELNLDGDCSLREAIVAANTDAAIDACPAGNGADTISLPTGNYVLTIAGTGENAALTGDLDITDDLTISGAGRASTTIDANGLDGVFQIFGASAQLSGLTVTGGESGSFAGSGIYLGVNGSLTLSNSRVTNNSPQGGIYSVLTAGPLNITNSRIDNNTGTGLFTSAAATTIIINSVISNNNDDSSGGGIYASGGTLTIVNSTISGNSANTHGGGLLSNGAAQLYNVTIANNTADSDADGIGEGGGIFFNSGTLTVRNSIIAGNFDPPGTPRDCSGTLTSEGYNLIGDTSFCTITGNTTGNITGVNPGLGTLQNNGGSTLTHALQASSPAIDAGHPTGCTDQVGVVLVTDQRGYARPIDGDGDGFAVCDMGAYEYNSPGTPTPTNTATATRTFTPSPSATRTATPTASRTPTPTRTPTRTATPTPTSTPTATATSTPRPTRTPMATVTRTPTMTPTNTLGPSPTPTSTSTATRTPTVTPTCTPGPDSGCSPTATATPFAPIYWLYLPVIQK